MQVKEGDWVLVGAHYSRFGRVLWVRDETLLIDAVTPGTCYSSETIRPELASTKNVIAVRAERFAIERAWAAIEAAKRPQPSADALTQVGLKAIRDAETSMAAVRADLEARRCLVSVEGSGS